MNPKTKPEQANLNIRQNAVCQNVRCVSEWVGHIKNYVRWPYFYSGAKINYIKPILTFHFDF